MKSFLPAYLNIHESSLLGPCIVFPGTEEILKFFNFQVVHRHNQCIMYIIYMTNAHSSHSLFIFLALCWTVQCLWHFVFACLVWVCVVQAVAVEIILEFMKISQWYQGLSYIYVYIYVCICIYIYVCICICIYA